MIPHTPLAVCGNIRRQSCNRLNCVYLSELSSLALFLCPGAVVVPKLYTGIKIFNVYHDSAFRRSVGVQLLLRSYSDS